MRQPRRRARHQSWPFGRILIAALTPLAVLVPAAIAGTGTALASPSAGYTASLIQTGAEGFAAAVDPQTNTAYIADTTSELSVINGASNTVSGTIALTARPEAVAVDPTTDTIYVPVVSGTAAALDVIDGATSTVTDIIALPAGSEPMGVAVDSSTDVVYVAEYGASAVTVVSGSSDTVTATVGTGSGTHPIGVAVDATTNVVWVADFAGNVFGISGASNTVTQTVSFSGAAVEGVDVDPGTDTVYAAIEGTSDVAVINGSTGTVTATISVTEPVFSVAVDPASGTVFASSFDGTTGSGTSWVIDETSNTITDTIQRGGLRVAVNTMTGSAYIAAEIALPREAWVLAPSAADAMSPVIQSTTAAFTVGTAGSFAIVGSALPAATYTEIGALPAGVTLSPSGALSGTPAAGTGGSYLIELMASNGIAPAYSQAFTLVVNPAVAPTITSAAQASFTLGVPNSFTVTATGSQATFSESGTLPANITFSTAGVLSGTPAPGTVGSYPITITASNVAGTATQAFTLTINPPVAPAITSADQTAFILGAASSFTVTASGVPASTFSESGTLPTGVTLSTAGVLSGTPAAGTLGSYPITITATNVAGTGTQAFTLIVGEVPAITTANQVTFTEGEAGSFAVTASGSPAPTFSETGQLPPGVTFSSSGVLSGTPGPGSFEDTWPITITASNALGTGTQSFTLLVVVPTATSSMPAVLNDSDGETSVFAVLSDGNVWVFEQGGVSTFVHQLSTTGDFTGTPAVLQAANGDIGIYARTTSGTLMGATQPGPGGGVNALAWGEIGTANNLTGDPVALMAANGTVAIYATDSAGAVEGISQSVAFGPFGSWQTLSPADGFTGRPSVLMTSGGLVAIYARTTAGTLLATSQHVKFGPFDPWAQIGSNAGLASDPAALIAANGAVAIYATDTAGVVDGISQSATGSAFGSWQPLSPADGFTGRPSVLMTSGGLVAIYARTTAGTVLATSQNTRFGPFSPWSQIGTATDLASDPAALITAAGTVAIFATDNTGDVSWISQTAPFGPFGSWNPL